MKNNAIEFECSSLSNEKPATLIKLFILLLFSTSPFISFAGTDKNITSNYTFGVFPYLSAKQLGNSYGPVAAEFSKVLQQKVKFTSTPSYEDFSKGLAEERFDIAMIQPFDYVTAVDNYNYLPLARIDADLRAHFVVKSESKFKNLGDLKGTQVALPSLTAALSRVSKKSLKSYGYTIGKDISVKNFNSFGSCLQDVLIGHSSTCATGVAAKKIFESRMNVKLRTIYKTPPIPHMTFVVHQRVAEKDRELLTNAIVNWNSSEHGRKIVKGTRLPGFRVINDSDYNVIREFDD